MASEQHPISNPEIVYLDAELTLLTSFLLPDSGFKPHEVWEAIDEHLDERNELVRREAAKRAGELIRRTFGGGEIVQE